MVKLMKGSDDILIGNIVNFCMVYICECVIRGKSCVVFYVEVDNF